MVVLWRAKKETSSPLQGVRFQDGVCWNILREVGDSSSVGANESSSLTPALLIPSRYR